MDVGENWRGIVEIFIAFLKDVLGGLNGFNTSIFDMVPRVNNLFVNKILFIYLMDTYQ